MKMLLSLAMGVFLATSGSATAENLVVSLVSPAHPVAPQATVKLDFLAVNPTRDEASFELPATLHARLITATKSWPVDLVSTRAGAVSVRPGAFSSRDYTLVLPPDVTGQVVLEVTEGSYAPLRGVLMISADSPATAKPEPASALSTLAAATPELANVRRDFIGHFEALDPVYFIYGTKNPGAKFQFSFKYRLLDFPSSHAATVKRSLEFGYTQRSLWDVTGDSSPFYDTSYMPSLFYESLASQSSDNHLGPIAWFGYQVGYQHESNGQSMVASRSMNTLFVRPAIIIGSPEDWHVIVVPKFWAYVGDLSNNPDIKNYRGYGELFLVFGRSGGTALAYTGHSGQHLNHVTSQLDLTIPIQLKLLDFASYFMVQYFDGYGESLRDYNKKSSALRAGISLVR